MDKIYMIKYVYVGPEGNESGFYNFGSGFYPSGIMHTHRAEEATDALERAKKDNPDTEYTLRIYGELKNG